MWLLVSIISYFMHAGVYVADKFLLSKKIHSSIAYAFFVGIWSIFNIFLLYFDPWIPSARELGIDLLAGMLFLVTLVFWYKALHQSEATRVVPIVGALVPIFSFILSFLFLGEGLNSNQLLAFFILINGGVLISIKHTKFYALKEVKEKFKYTFGNLFGVVSAEYRPASRLLMNSITSAMLFAAYYVLIKYIYNTQPFIGGFVWSRMGSFLGVIIIFLVPEWRKLISKHRKAASKPKNFGIFILIRIIAAAAFIMINYAISLGNVALVNALQGVQYIFLFIIVLIISTKYPKILKEEMGGDVLVQKMIGASLICIGLYMLTVSNL